MIIWKGEAFMSVKIGGTEWKTWEDIRDEIFTPEEIAESDFRVALIGELIKARNDKGMSQRELAKISGVRQPVIARIEKGKVSPNLDTVNKLLFALGKRLDIVDI